MSSILSVTDEGAAHKQTKHQGGMLRPPAVTFGGHVLVAEDNRINQLYVVELLKLFGCTSDLVSNGEEALAAVKRHQYDLVLMDCQMPEMDGFAAAREIRKCEAAGKFPGRIPIVALTANALKGDQERCIDAGMDEYVIKPVEANRLRAVLETFLGKSSQEASADSRGN